MRNFLLASVMILTIAPAGAADLKGAPASVYKAPVASSFNWSGFYVWGYGSYSANFAGMDTTVAPTSPTPTIINLASIPHGPGFGGGLEVFFQQQGSPWVLGAEADIGVMNLQNGSTLATGGVAALSISNQSNYLGAVNVELGYAGLDPKLLVGVKGGFAFGGAKPNLMVAGACAGGTNCTQAISDTSVGWDFGAFMKYAFTDHLNVGIEGRYTDLGSRSLTVTPTGGTIPIATSTAKYNFLSQLLTVEYKL
jgi:outer membrane immunogenic protein